MRRTLALIVLGAIVLAAGGVLYPVVFREPPAAPPPAVPSGHEDAPSGTVDAASEALWFEAAEVQGAVTIRREGAWLPLDRGDRVPASAAIRTGAGGRAVLRSEKGDELILKERVELEVASLSRTVTELELTAGKVRARAGPETERLQIRSADASATGKGGSRFTIYLDPAGALTVASQDGRVTVAAMGREVALPPNHETHVARGLAPTDPVLVPDEVFVNVAWPEDEVHTTSVIVRGRTRPGTEITVNGRPAPSTDKSGAFSIELPLREGPNHIEVTAEPIQGQPRSVKRTISRDTKPPPLDVDTADMYGSPP